MNYNSDCLRRKRALGGIRGGVSEEKDGSAYTDIAVRAFSMQNSNLKVVTALLQDPMPPRVAIRPDLLAGWLVSWLAG